jgi:hypothetical protein
VGFLSLISEDPARPTWADREAIAAVTTVIAQGLDRTRELAETARIVEAAGAGVWCGSPRWTALVPNWTPGRRGDPVPAG